MAESTELFDLKNYFFIGNYQGAVNEGMSINAKTLGEPDKIAREVYIYRSYIAQGNHKFVLNEISDSANTSLRAVKLLASYYATENKDVILSTLKEWFADSATANNSVVQIIGATIYYLEENFEEALRCVYHNGTLEGVAFLVQIYMKINRVDLAEKELQKLQKLDDDATLTQLARTWVYLAQGGEKAVEAQSIYNDMIEKYGQSVLLLNGIALSCMQLKKWGDAEKYLLSALEKNSSEVDTIINLIVCYQQQRKSNDIVNRQINQLKSIAPNCGWLKNYKRLEDQFDSLAKQFAV